MCRASFLALVLFQFSVLPPSAFARVAGGTLSGTVTDARGSVFRNAEITITNVETGIGRSASTNEVGGYVTAELLPGGYDVKFLALGFKSEVKSGIALTVGAGEVADLPFAAGTDRENCGFGQQLTMSGARPLATWGSM